MKLIFFKDNVSYATEQIRKTPQAFCAFWYTNGLTSYKGIDSIVDTTELFVEESIYSPFCQDYPELEAKYSITVYSSSNDQLKLGSKLCFFASNDTMVYLYKNILQNLPSNSWSLFCKEGENAHNIAKKIGIKSKEVTSTPSEAVDSSLLVMANDWGLLEQKINYDFIYSGKNSICLQESVIDFNIVDQRMLHCSFPVFQGIATLKSVELQNKICAVIGNPRYEDLKPSPLPAEDKVMINVNFTYGIYEEARQNWVDDIVNACNELNVDYQISQHPRDRGSFQDYNLVHTNASNVHQILKESSILVTRFSSLIHEALSLGRPVIYYNPHNEKLFYEFEPDNSSFIYAKNKEELVDAFKYLILKTTRDSMLNTINNYLPRHLGVTHSEGASKFIKLLIDDVTNFPPLKKRSLLKSAILSAKVAKRRILQEKF